MRGLYDSGSYPAVGTVLGEAAWVETLSPEELADVLRSSLREEYADASDAEMGDALENVLDSMSAAEAFNFGSALSQIGKSATKLASDPTFAQIVRTAAPIAGGALGSVIGGPVGLALGSQLGNLAAQALPAPPGPAPARVAPPPAAPSRRRPQPCRRPPRSHPHPHPRPWRRRPPLRRLPRRLRPNPLAPRHPRRKCHPRREFAHPRSREDRLRRRRASSSASNRRCCAACWRRRSASGAVSRSAAFPWPSS